MSSDHYINYIKRVDDASIRTRNVIYFLVITCVILGVSSWNIRPGNWEQRELETLRIILEVENAKYDDSEPGHAKAREYAALAGMKDVTDAKMLAARIEPKRTAIKEAIAERRAYVSMPIIGVQLHSNDLGLVGGITLVIIMLLLRFGLWRE